MAAAFTKLNYYAHTYWLNLFNKTERSGIDKVWEWTLLDMALFLYKNIIGHSALIHHMKQCWTNIYPKTRNKFRKRMKKLQYLNQMRLKMHRKKYVVFIGYNKLKTKYFHHDISNISSTKMSQRSVCIGLKLQKMFIAHQMCIGCIFCLVE